MSKPKTSSPTPNRRSGRHATHVAHERRELLKQRDADLASLQGMPLLDLFANINMGRYGDPKVKAAARNRVKTEMIGSDEVAALLPLCVDQVERFLHALGIQKVGHVSGFTARHGGERWCRREVLAAIALTTARLYHRARHEFHGQLPGHLHTRMVLSPADEFATAYCEFLAAKERAYARALSEEGAGTAPNALDHGGENG